MSPVTISELAAYRLHRPAVTGADFQEASLPVMGGCVSCGACIAAYNAHPSKSGYLACAQCVGEGGWADVSQANRDIFEEPRWRSIASDWRM